MSKATPSHPRHLADVDRWEIETDVAIVGFGGAGACAAIEASDAGAEVTPQAESVGTPQTDGYAPTDVTFAPDLAVDLDAMSVQESGLYVQVLREGEGPQAVAGDQMGIHYTVWLTDGSKLDSSYDHQPPGPYPTVLGVIRLIDGWNEGVTGMRQGEMRRLVVPYQLGYGPDGRPGVPGYATLVFEVELTEHTPAAGQ
jgi:FKBP-type peptidyl-prolyl cis-trans isomerase